MDASLLSESIDFVVNRHLRLSAELKLEIITKLLKLHPEPAEHRQIMAAFGKAFEQLPAPGIEKLLSDYKAFHRRKKPLLAPAEFLAACQWYPDFIVNNPKCYELLAHVNLPVKLIIAEGEAGQFNDSQFALLLNITIYITCLCSLLI